MDCLQNIFCPLCGQAADAYYRDKKRPYFRCINCHLVFVEPEFFLSVKDEKSRYDFHENSPRNQGYRRFLSKMRDPIMERVPVGSCGLDFGSGPGPTLSIMFEEKGYPTAIYDPLYASDESVLKNKYDFVTSTEVVEHLRTPAASLNKMWRCVRTGGYLGIMTRLLINKNAFSDWHYKNDDTHICFFSRETFVWLSRQWQSELEFEGNDIMIYKK